jgi:hypothetical protein
VICANQILPSGPDVFPAAVLTADWPRAVNSGIEAAPGLKIGAGDMDEVDSARPLFSFSLFSPFLRWLASGGEFRHRDGAPTEDRSLRYGSNQILPSGPDVSPAAVSTAGWSGLEKAQRLLQHNRH